MAILSLYVTPNKLGDNIVFNYNKNIIVQSFSCKSILYSLCTSGGGLQCTKHNYYHQFDSEVVTSKFHGSKLLLWHICCVFESLTYFCVPQSQSSDFTRPDTLELYLQVMLEFTKHQSQVYVDSVIKRFTLSAARVRLGWTMALY